MRAGRSVALLGALLALRASCFDFQVPEVHVIAFSLSVSPVRRFAPFTTTLSVTNTTVTVQNVSTSGIPRSILPDSVFDDVDPADRAASASSDPGPLVYALLPQSTEDGAASALALAARTDRLGGFLGGGQFPSLADLPTAVATPGWDVVRLRTLQGQPSLVYRTEHESESDPDVTCRLVADEFIDFQWRSDVVVHRTMGTQAVGCLGLRPVSLPQVHRMTARLYVGLLPVMILYVGACVGGLVVVSAASYAMDRGMIPVFDGKAQALTALRLAVFGAEVVFWLDLAATGTAPVYSGLLIAAMVVGFVASAGCARYFFRLDTLAEDLPVKEAVRLWAFENQPTVWAVSVAAGMGGHVAAAAFSGLFALRRFSCPAGVARRVVYTWLGLPVALTADAACLAVATLLLHRQTPDVVIPLSAYGAGFMSALGIATVAVVAVLAPVAEEESRYVSRLAAIFAMKRQAQWVKAQEEKALQEAEENERRALELEEAGGVLEDREDRVEEEAEDGTAGQGGLLAASTGPDGESKASVGDTRVSSGRSSGRGTARIVRKVGVGARTKGLRIATARSTARATARSGTNPFTTGRRSGRLSGRMAPADGLTAAERELAAREDAYRLELQEEAAALGVDADTMEGQLELAKRAEEPLELDNKGGFVGLSPPVPLVKGVRPDVVRYMQKAVRARGVYRGPSTQGRRVQGVTRDGRRVAFGAGADVAAVGGTGQSTGLGGRRGRRRSGAAMQEAAIASKKATAQIAVPGMSRVKEDGGGRGRVGGRRSIVAEAREAMQAGLGLAGGAGGHYKKDVWGGDGAVQTVGGPPEPFDEATYQLPSVIHGRPNRRSSSVAGAGASAAGGQLGAPTGSSAGSGDGSADASGAPPPAAGGALALGVGAGSSFPAAGAGPRSPTPEARGAAMGLQWAEGGGSETGSGGGSGAVGTGGRGDRGRLVSQASARSYASSTGGLLPGSVASDSEADFGSRPASPSQRSVASSGSEPRDDDEPLAGRGYRGASGVALDAKRRLPG